VDSRRPGDEVDEHIVTEQQGQQLKKDIGALYYTECSSVYMKGVVEVFETAVRAALEPPPKRTSKCRIL